MPEYIYIREVNKSSVHIGRTTDLEERYKLQADQTIEDFKEYLFIFECEEGKGSEIERDVKTKFKEYIVSNTDKNEQYLWNEVLKEKYTHYLRIHKYIIRQFEDDEVLKYNKNKQQTKIVVKEKKRYQPRKLKELGLTPKDVLGAAQKWAQSIQKNNASTRYTAHDEYYTRYEDVENMCGQFAKEFKGKVVFCNCDDVLDDNEKKCSAFALYFKKNFKKLKLKKLICLHFAGISDIFHTGETLLGMIYTYDGDVIEVKKEKDFDGSFYHPKSIKILNEEADIVCTNHPWSLTRKFYDVVLASGKKFLVISNKNIILMPSFFMDIKSQKIKPIKGVDDFYGKNFINVRASGIWVTNFDYKRDKYPKLLPMSEIPKENIEIDDKGMLLFNNGYIPIDYEGTFAISTAPIISGILEQGYQIVGDEVYVPYIKKARQFGRLLIKKSKPSKTE